MSVFGIIFLLSPFPIAWAIAYSTYRATGRIWHGLVMFIAATSGLGILYSIGFTNAGVFAEDKLRTASTLSVGLLPFKSIPVLLICLAVLVVAQRRARRNRTLP